MPNTSLQILCSFLYQYGKKCNLQYHDCNGNTVRGPTQSSANHISLEQVTVELTSRDYTLSVPGLVYFCKAGHVIKKNKREF